MYYADYPISGLPMWWEVIALSLWIIVAMTILKMMNEEEYSIGIDTVDMVFALLWPFICVAFLLGYKFGEDDV